jgi:hypothetical protein
MFANDMLSIPSKPKKRKKNECFCTFLVSGKITSSFIGFFIYYTNALIQNHQMSSMGVVEYPFFSLFKVVVNLHPLLQLMF